MLHRCTAWVLGAVIACAVPAGVAGIVPPHPSVGALAEYIPVDAQLFLEVRDVANLSRTPAGAALGDVLAWVMNQVRAGAPSTQPSAGRGWRQLFASALGLQNDRVADLLLSGRLAIAADGLSELGAAVLVAEPANPAGVEALLKAQLVAGAQGRRVRQYRLGPEVAVATDGKVVVVGRQKSKTDLYARTAKLLESDRGLCLADLAEFRERVAEVPAASQIVCYMGTNLRRVKEEDSGNSGRFLLGPSLRCAALAIQATHQGLVVETAGQRVAPLAAQPVPHDPPVDVLLFLPSSVVAAWTYPVDYPGELKRLRASHSQGVIPFYLNLLQWRMKPDGLDNGLLRHLVGDTVFTIGQVTVRPRSGLNDAETLLMPTFALCVGVDAPDVVEATLEELAANVLRLVNLQSAPESRVTVHTETLTEADESTLLWCIPLATLFPPGALRELMGSLELSWAVADRRLVIGTHRETVRQIVLGQRGATPLMPADAIQAAMRRERLPDRLPDTMFVAQPAAASEIMESWLRYIAKNHPEMQQPQWWRQLRRQYGESQVQLGIRPAVGAAPGVVEVADTMPNWPAHGRLLKGDRITAVDGRKLDPKRAMQSLRDAVVTRPRDEKVRLSVIRQGREMAIEVSMPVSSSPADHVQPLVLLKEISDLSRMFAFASYVTWQPSRELVQTRLELRLTSAVTAASVGQPSNGMADEPRLSAFGKSTADSRREPPGLLIGAESVPQTRHPAATPAGAGQSTSEE